MIKIGILLFTEKSHDTIVEIIDNYDSCKVIGVSRFEKMIMVDDNYSFINSINKLIAVSDLLIIDSASTEHVELLSQIIKNSKHLYLINTKKFTQNDTNELLKLKYEAGTILLISQPHRSNPLFDEILTHLKSISFVNITENGVHQEDCLLYGKLIEKVDLLLMIINSNIYRISACSSSDEFMNIRLEFNNAVNANITINQLADSNNSWIEILSPGENIKIDFANFEVFKINKTKKSKIFEKNGNKEALDNNNILRKEFEMLINSIVSGMEPEYDITHYHFANILAEEILKKISYVLT